MKNIHGNFGPIIYFHVPKQHDKLWDITKEALRKIASNKFINIIFFHMSNIRNKG